MAGKVATIGFFDGVHAGHRFLLGRVMAESRERQLDSAAVSFCEHPRRVLHADYVPCLLTTNDEKRCLLREVGIRHTILLDFTPGMARMTAADFMRDILRRRLGVEVLVVGYDHRFGRPQGETFEDYCRYGHRCGVEVLQAEPFLLHGQPVSSSRVRALLTEGRVEEAAEALTRPYSLSGEVVEGRRVGRSLGFPTANLRPAHAHKLIPAPGVYAVAAEAGGQTYKAMLNIGSRPTLANGADTTIEAHLLHFAGSLYGEKLTLRFIRRLRAEQKFPTLEALQAQLKIDARTVENAL